jgi:hypothetical protein
MPRFTFSGHETFPLRYSWLPKGLRELDRDSDLFFKDEAMVRLGVGKNMVRAVRHWCTALGMAKVDGRKSLGEVTPLGRRLFLGRGDDRPWDPYLEDPGTLWLFQWMLASREHRASTWHLAFTQWGAELFTKEELIDWLHGIVQELDKSRATKNSLKRDVDVFIRTYVPTDPSPHRPPEDTFDSPLVELGLIRQEEKKLYRFVRGQKDSLPQAIFTYALLDYWHDSKTEEAAMSFERLLYEPGSPGGAFKLTERALATRLDCLDPWVGLRFDETAGLRTLYRTADEAAQPIEALETYYDRQLEEVAA